MAASCPSVCLLLLNFVAALLERSPLVTSYWCDYCGLELRALSRAYPEILAAGREVISIVPGMARYARKPRRCATCRADGRRPRLCLKPRARVLGRPEDHDLGFSIDLAQFQGNDGWFLPILATLATAGSRRAVDFRHRMRMEEILQAVHEAVK